VNFELLNVAQLSYCYDVLRTHSTIYPRVKAFSQRKIWLRSWQQSSIPVSFTNASKYTTRFFFEVQTLPVNMWTHSSLIVGVSVIDWKSSISALDLYFPWMVYDVCSFPGSYTSHLEAGKICLFLSYHLLSTTFPGCDSSMINKSSKDRNGALPRKEK